MGFREYIGEVLGGAITRGKEQVDKTYGLQQPGVEERDRREHGDVVRQFEALIEKIIQFVKRTATEDEVWESRESADAYCARLARQIDNANNRAAFVRFQEKVAHVDRGMSDQRWNEFLRDLKNIRARTRADIIRKIQQIEEAEEKRAGVVVAVEPDEAKKFGTTGGAVTSDEKREGEKLEAAPTKKKNGKKEEQAALGMDVPPVLAHRLGEYAKAVSADDEAAKARAFDDLLEQVALDAANTRTLESDLSKLSSGIQDLEARLDAAQIADLEHLEEKDAVIATLQEKVAELEKEKTLSASVSKSTVAEQPNPEKKSDKKDFSQVKEMITHRLAEITEKIDKWAQHSADVTETLADLKENLRKEVLKIKVQLSDPAAEESLQARQATVLARLDAIEEKRLSLESMIAGWQEEKLKLEQFLRAVRLVEKGLSETTAAEPAHEEDHALVLPSLEELMSEVARTEVISRKDEPTQPIKVAKPAAPEAPTAKLVEMDKKKLAGPEVFKVEGLPFKIEFTEEDSMMVKGFEQIILSFRGNDPGKISNLLALSASDYLIRREEYLQLLLLLQEGRFLDLLKEAVVVLGTMSKGEAHAPRTMKKIADSMVVSGAKIERYIKDARAVADALSMAELLGTSRATLKLVEKEKSTVALTELGKKAFQVWTQDLIKDGKLALRQLVELYNYAQRRD